MIYVGSSKELICRDGNRKYAESMDLEFHTYDYLNKCIELSNFNEPIIIDIAAGWTTKSDMEIIHRYISLHPKLVYIRLVDQFSHQLTSDAYSELLKLWSEFSHKIKLIGTYEVDYYGMDTDLVLPYPYLESEEINNDWESRKDLMILTGSDIEEIYPMRKRLYRMTSKLGFLDSLGHPGYSGKHWNEGVIGNEYLNLLSKYKFMICTTCIEGYELLKYIECAEAGCICVGEVPPSLVGTEVEKWIVKIPEPLTYNHMYFHNWFYDTVSKLANNDLYAKNYRTSIKSIRNKELIKLKLYEFISSKST